MDKSEFSSLIEKYQQNSLSDKERALLNEWFDSFSGESVDEPWSEQERNILREKIIARLGYTAVEDHESRTVTWPSQLWRVAASLLLVVSLTYMLLQFWKQPGKPGVAKATVVSVSGGIKKVLLPDGSLVWLKGHSSLSHPESFAERQRSVRLEGEALFEVSPDASRPFVIQCGGLTTTVLGTSFNIRGGEENIEVVVLTGKVSLTSERDPEGIVVLPNEKALYWRDGKRLAKVETAIDKGETRKAVAGTEYPMDFEDTRMREVIRRIEGKFGVSIRIEDERLANCVITADFTGQPLEGTLDMIAEALGGWYRIADGVVTIAGNGCN